MIHRSARVDVRTKSGSLTSRSNSTKSKATPLLQRRRHTFWALILGSLLSCYLATVVLLSENGSSAFTTSSENPLSTFSMGNEWKAFSSSESHKNRKRSNGRVTQNQTVLLYIDGEISAEDEKAAANSLQSLVNQFGSQSLQKWEVIRQADNQEKNFDIATQNLPCVWITKKGPVQSSLGSNPSGRNVHSRCIQMVATAASDDPTNSSMDWRLHKQGSVGSTKPGRSNSNSTICLPRQVGPRQDFWQRGVNFERVGLWMQAASIRSYVWNLALVPDSQEQWLSDAIHKVGKESFSDGRNASGIVITKPLDDYKPVPYFRDLLTSVFTVVVFKPESAVSSQQNITPQGRKQRNKKQRKESPGQHKSMFWKQLQEVILSGSIPIVITMGSPNAQMDCNHELFFGSNSPILVLPNQMKPLLTTLWEEPPAKLNARQDELRVWYQRTMIQRAIQVEDWILDTTPSSKAPSSDQRLQLAKEYLQDLTPFFLQQRRHAAKPLCLTPPFYGRTNNKVIEIGKLLKLSYQEGKHRALALDRRWSNWYRPHFDERDDVLLDYYPHGECEKTFTAREAFEITDWDLSYLIHLLPRHDYRERAEKIINTWQHGNNYISVHRRDLEGSCHVHAKCSDVELETSTCLQKRDPTEICSAELRLRACDMEYNMVPNPEGLPIVLFTDGQVPAKDGTFPHMFNTTDFFVEMWLMVKSKTHWGNPRSTVDAVVSSWREGREMEPKECYPT
ncbi:unnamed protein product [Cylindrotheca closterium]|uniref:Uncharacterized protein n=1 Tax=Cylindrotheca closterium TaxID=2856 RepID=A0AAD2CUB6_9STRA|nr:unnamed protein product [Cylindrotheca closterium]